MYINKIELFNFKPLLHAGNTLLSIDNISDITVLIGCNGCGKTTVLKELTPFPSITSDYEKDGYKYLEITHNGSEYIIKSLFDGKKGEHSFIKDNDELNISKKANVQQELCESEFGLTPIIKSIITGSLDICNMGRAERKSLLLSCYPSNMDFVLNYHKKILFEIKAIKGNLTLLSQRKADLESNKISDEMYSVLEKNLTFLNDLKEEVNKKIILFSDEISRMESNTEYNPVITNIEFNTIKDKILDQQHKCAMYRISNPELFKNKSDSEIIKLTTSRDYLKDTKIKLEEDIQNIHLDLEKYAKLSEESSDEKFKSVVSSLESYKSELNKLSIDDSIPILDVYVSNKINVELLDKHIQAIYTSDSNIYSYEEYNNKTYKIKELERELYFIDNELNNLLKSLDTLNIRFNNINKYKFKDNCDLPCPAREKYSNTLDSLKKDQTELQSNIDKLSTKKDKLKQELSKLNDSVNNCQSLLPSIKFIEELIRELDVNTYLLGNMDLDKSLQKNPLEIRNKIVKIRLNSINQYRWSELTNYIKELEYKLETLNEARRQTSEFVGNTVIDKKTKLEQLTNDYTSINKSLLSIDNLLNKYDDINKIENDIENIKSVFNTNVLAVIINEKIKLLKSCHIDLIKYRDIIEDEQLIIKSTIKEKESIKIRLEEEVMPTINNLVNELGKLQSLEKALSPTSGIPHAYMTRFINNILAYSNLFISKVWAYEMELELLKESNTLTFDFEIKLYENSILKDINMLSKGQKEMVNIAFIVSLYVIMNLGNIFPLKFDEVDSGFSYQHRDKLVNLIAELVYKKDITQLFLVNHHSTLYTAMPNANIVCLNSEGIIMPNEYNKNTIIK